LEIDNLRDLNDDQLKKELNETQRELMNLRFRASTMQLSNVNQIKKSKKKISRMLTIMRERELVRTQSA